MTSDFEYEDLLDLPHFEPSSRHPRMDRHKRASQFAPFDALNGFGEEIEEHSRLTKKKIILDDDAISEINDILQSFSREVEYIFTYFVPDKTKDGGEYKIETALIKKVDFNEGSIFLSNGSILNISDIIRIRVAGKY